MNSKTVTFTPYSDDCCPTSMDDEAGLSEHHIPKVLTITDGDAVVVVRVTYGPGGWETRVTTRRTASLSMASDGWRT